MFGCRLLQIDVVYSVPDVGTVVGGHLTTGMIRENDELLLGPSTDGQFLPVVMHSIQRSKLACRLVQAGQACTLALNHNHHISVRKVSATCHYDVIDFAFVAKRRDRRYATAPLGNKHKIDDVIMTSRSYHETSISFPFTQGCTLSIPQLSVAVRMAFGDLTGKKQVRSPRESCGGCLSWLYVGLYLGYYIYNIF